MNKPKKYTPPSDVTDYEKFIDSFQQVILLEAYIDELEKEIASMELDICERIEREDELDKYEW